MLHLQVGMGMAAHTGNGSKVFSQSVEAQPVFIRMLRGARREERRVEGESEEESMQNSPQRIPPPRGYGTLYALQFH